MGHEDQRTLGEFLDIVRSVTDRVAKEGYPQARDVKHVVGVCEDAERDHAKSPRTYAHAHHLPNTVCWAKAALSDLNESNIMGITAHEYGHLFKKERKKNDEENEAHTDFWVLNHFGIELGYDERDVQYVRAYHVQGRFRNMEEEDDD